LAEAIELRLAAPPVVLGAPTLHECLDPGRLGALGDILDRLPVGPANPGEAFTKIRQLRLGNFELERLNRS
jgi:hypothetical protein